LEAHPLRFFRNLSRSREIFTVLLNHGFGDLLERLKLRRYVQWGRRVILRKRQSEIPQHYTTAERIRMALEELGPTFIKFGQVMSTRPDLVPADVIAELEHLQESVPPFPSEQAIHRLEVEFQKPIEELFAEFDRDPLAALEAMGRAARARTDARIVAVTGSVGKTGTKDALRLCLGACGKTAASVASYNNQWGVPLSLARMPADTRFGVFEIGMNHPGEITPLTRMVRPHVAIVTTVEPCHIGFFDSLDEIADAKAEIFAGLEPGGTAVLNRDNAYFDRLKQAAEAAGAGRIVGFGEDERADARVRTMVLHEDWSTVSASVLGHYVTYKLGAPGRHVVMNSLAVLAASVLAGADLARVALRLRDLEPPKGRGARLALRVRGGEATLIDESYNANPTSVRAALDVLSRVRPGRGGRRIVVLGDMLELGGEAPALHAGLAGPIDGAGVDVVYACGPHMAHLWERLDPSRRGAYAQTSAELVDPLVAGLGPGDVVMVKGSLGMRMGLVVTALKEAFAAREPMA